MAEFSKQYIVRHEIRKRILIASVRRESQFPSPPAASGWMTRRSMSRTLPAKLHRRPKPCSFEPKEPTSHIPMTPPSTDSKYVKGIVTSRRELGAELWVIRMRPESKVTFNPGQSPLSACPPAKTRR